MTIKKTIATMVLAGLSYVTSAQNNFNIYNKKNKKIGIEFNESKFSKSLDNLAKKDLPTGTYYFFEKNKKVPIKIKTKYMNAEINKKYNFSGYHSSAEIDGVEASSTQEQLKAISLINALRKRDYYSIGGKVFYPLDPDTTNPKQILKIVNKHYETDGKEGLSQTELREGNSKLIKILEKK